MTLDEWRFSLEIAWDDAWFRWQTSLTLASVMLGSLFFLWRLIPVGLRNGQLIFHYNLYLGIDEVHAWWWVLFVPILLILVVLGNIIASARLFRRDKIASRVLLCASTVFTVLLFLAAFFITSVNV
ncbi:hypothetical protein KJZ71_01800 [Patescibacteria group bacterium]|jgi:hypothetical protein|uniref:Uncharacterized protein n=1 Tax=candidate division WWE3 bacterium TaxID=2053526 RepID=A0A928TWH2_UNCKA|nr:hypothetical protein [candidate division WWE3 bacterium]MCL4732521.1 hypothetical protein [Patescibacteria group bacterium]MDL1952571.1 hypothetical protein [Candidatus Uhrbacteria bacterium UHB]RIL01295.1 MAG: hypothetical protein DCC77_02020 [Candidatus Uhrbacteria bacterium]